jgi:hypothetical protein
MNKYLSVGTVQKSNRKILDRDSKDENIDE